MRFRYHWICLFLKWLSFFRFDILLRDLENYFSEAIKVPPTPIITANSLARQQGLHGTPKRSYSHDSDDETSVNADDLARRSSAAAHVAENVKEIELRPSLSRPNLAGRKSSSAYLNGKQLTARLAYVSLTFFNLVLGGFNNMNSTR